jgi:hypothetical protein
LHILAAGGGQHTASYAFTAKEVVNDQLNVTSCFLDSKGYANLVGTYICRTGSTSYGLGSPLGIHLQGGVDGCRTTSFQQAILLQTINIIYLGGSFNVSTAAPGSLIKAKGIIGGGCQLGACINIAKANATNGVKRSSGGSVATGAGRRLINVCARKVIEQQGATNTVEVTAARGLLQVETKDARRINNAGAGAGLAGAAEAKSYIRIAINTGRATHQELLNIGAKQAINGS